MPKAKNTPEPAQDAGTDIVTLTPDQRAAQALSYEATAAELKALAASSTSLVRVDTEDNLAAAKAARAKLVTTRTTIARVGKEARDDANAFSKAVIAKEKALVALISPEETRLGTLVDDEVRRRAEAERVAREQEERRAEEIRSAFARIREIRDVSLETTVARIDELIEEARKLHDDPSHLPENLQAAARYEANVTTNSLKAARDRRVQADKDAAELEELRREKAEREDRERRAEANRQEAERASTVIAQNPANVLRGVVGDRADHRSFDAAAASLDDDDDLPPGHAPTTRVAQAATLATVTVPAAGIARLVQAANALLAICEPGPECDELAAAVDEVTGRV